MCGAAIQVTLPGKITEPYLSPRPCRGQRLGTFVVPRSEGPQPAVAMMAASAALQRIPADHPSAADAAVATLRQDGACIVEGMFAASTIATMRSAVQAKATRDAEGDAKPGSASQGYIDAVDTQTDSAPDWVEGFVGANTVRFSSLGKIGGTETRDAYFSMLDNPLYHEVADQILLPFTGSYWVNTAQAMLIGPGSPSQPLHRDADNCESPSNL